MKRFFEYLRRSRSPLVCLLLFAPACGTLRLQPGTLIDPPGKLITAAQIEHTGARNAWDALLRSHVHLSFAEGRAGEGRHLAQRGPHHQAPLVVVNGVFAVGSYGMLSALPARSIQSIRVLSATQAMTPYGMAASGGAIVIEVRTGPAR